MGLYLGSVHAHLSGHDNLGLIKKTDRLLAWVDDWKAYLQQTEDNTILQLQTHTKTGRILDRDLCINRSNHQKPTFHPLGDFLNPALALLGQGLKKLPIGQKLDFANHPYLCKGLR
ncbi:hypothetical protein BSPCLSOX_447 [uncultured Gammaproteobacteria bacterium]|nr:hypothetical protein BSPCLSOX_447 [uncultured Gammaproteobacteria bacterium]